MPRLGRIAVAVLSLSWVSACSFDESGVTSDALGEPDGRSVDARAPADGPVADASTDGAPLPPDAAPLPDAPLPPDAAPHFDAPLPPDAAPLPDAPLPPDAAPPPDAPPDYVVVEVLVVPVNGDVVTSTTTLEAGVTYRMRASGTFTINIAMGLIGDAEYWDFSDPPTSINDMTGTVDVGMAIDDPTWDLSRTPRWGPYSSSHVYEIEFPGTGDTIDVSYQDGNPNNNAGSLTLEILAPL